MGDWSPIEREIIDAGMRRTIERRIAQGIGSRDDHAREGIRRRGLRVRCERCGSRTRMRTHRGRRLRSIECPSCGAEPGSLHPIAWAGFDAPEATS